MCGIAGFNFNDRAVIEEMTQALAHRGPDDEGFYADENVSLGHRRLSVIDTSDKGSQPMCFEHLVVVYNGEVYNFQELREELISEGYNFVSGTDTEVVLYSYHCWGQECVRRFNGIWSFCVYDMKEETFFLSRDRFGIKPLYYYFDGDRFIFASELKAIRKHELDLEIDAAGLNSFFYQKYIAGSHTIFQNCHKLRPGENIVFDMKQKKLEISRYYDLEDEIDRALKTPLKARLKTVEDIIIAAVEKRLVADVPVGSFLSGGVDSSLISAIIAKRKSDFDTFTIGFKEQSYDEVDFSKEAADHIKTAHHIEYMDVDEESIKYVIKNMDEPFGDASVMPTYLLSKITRRAVTVSLSGDAGDEVFGGYDSYLAYKIARLIPLCLVKAIRPVLERIGPSDEKLTLAFKMQKFVKDFDANVNRRHLNWMGTFGDTERQRILKDKFVASDEIFEVSERQSLLSVQMNDVENYMAEDILKKVDIASMLNSLEVRVPFLDHELVPLILSLPDGYKIKNFKPKRLLKSIASKYLPARIVQRKKRGFTVPISRWIKENGFVREFIENDRYYEHDLLDRGYVQGLLSDHLAERKDNARQLWLVCLFNCWWDSNVENCKQGP